MDTLKKILKSYIFDGIVLVLSGIALIIWPGTALGIIVRVIGAVFALLGIIKIIVFFVNKNKDRKATDLFIGLVQLALGAALIIKPDFFISFFYVVMGIILVYGSVLMFIRAVRLRKQKGPMFVLALIFGFLMLALAVVIFINPAVFANFITVLYGISLVCEGLAMLIVLNKLKEI